MQVSPKHPFATFVQVALVAVVLAHIGKAVFERIERVIDRAKIDNDFARFVDVAGGALVLKGGTAF